MSRENTGDLQHSQFGGFAKCPWSGWRNNCQVACCKNTQKACERAGRWSKMPDDSTNDLTIRTYFSSDRGFLY